MKLIEEIMNEICEVMDKFDEDTLDQAMTLLSKDKKITPALRENEVYLAISGSGTTKNTLSNAKAAKKLGLKIIAVTSKEESELGQLADCIIKVPGRIKGDQKTASIQLLSSLFDQSVHIVLDELCLKLSRRDKVSDEMAAGNHVNVE